MVLDSGGKVIGDMEAQDALVSTSSAHGVGIGFRSCNPYRMFFLACNTWRGSFSTKRSAPLAVGVAQIISLINGQVRFPRTSARTIL
jgi:hypothetical protein